MQLSSEKKKKKGERFLKKDGYTLEPVLISERNAETHCVLRHFGGFGNLKAAAQQIAKWKGAPCSCRGQAVRSQQLLLQSRVQAVLFFALNGSSVHKEIAESEP